MVQRLIILLLASFGWLANSVQAQDLVVGQSVPLSGINANFGRDMRDGAAAVFAKVNAQNGIAGRKIQLLALDDGNLRERALQNTKELIETKKALLLFGYGSATTTLDALTLIKQYDMALFAPFTGSANVRRDPRVFTIRASYAEEAAKISESQKALGMTNVLVVHYDDAVGQSDAQSVVSAMDLVKKPRTLMVKRYARLNEAFFAPIFNDLPAYVLVVAEHTVAVDLLQAVAARNVRLPVVTLSQVNSDELTSNYGDLAQGVLAAQVVPTPRGGMLVKNAAIRDCAALLKDYSGKTLNYTSLESCLAAKTIVRVIQKLGTHKVTRASLLRGLEEATRIDLDGFVVNFSKDNSGSSFVDLVVLSGGR